MDGENDSKLRPRGGPAPDVSLHESDVDCDTRRAGLEAARHRAHAALGAALAAW